MKNFYQWAKEREYDLQSILDSEETKTEQSAKRAAVRSHAYPPLYGSGQYPDAYFRPIAADAPAYQKK